MAYASRSGRARTSSSNPQAHAICDRCGFRYNRVDLGWQWDWRGATKQNIRILVCNTCMDGAQEQLRAIIVPADPVPIDQPRVQDFVSASTDYQTVSATPNIDPVTGIPIPPTTTLVTQDGVNLLTQQIGIPADLDQGAVMPLEGTQHYRVHLTPLSVSAIGTDQIVVTFTTAHNLSTNDQISVQGLSDDRACGTYSVTVTSPLAFTYQVNVAIPSSGLLTSTTYMVTANVGIPYGFTQVPQTGVA